MDDDTENEARTAAQGLLDIAIKAAKKNVEPQPVNFGPSQASVGSADFGKAAAVARPLSPGARLSVTPRSQPMGRLVTSGDSMSLRLKDESNAANIQSESRRKDNFQQPKPKKSSAQDRVTVIVHKPAETEPQPPPGLAEAEPVNSRNPSFDIPVPPSAFAAPTLGSGDSAKSSVDFTPFARTATPTKEAETRGQEDINASKEDERPAKKPRLNKDDRAVSINTILQRVGSKEMCLADSLGNPPQTVQELVPPMPVSTDAAQNQQPDTMAIADSMQAPAPQRPPASVLMPRNSSDQSTMDQHRQIAQTHSGETVNPYHVRRQRSTHAMDRDYNAERDLHAHGKVKAEDSAAPATETKSDIQAQLAANPSKESEMETQTILWSGKIKHRLRTAEGASVAELFSLEALVPAKLIEQLPATIFVNALIGRANVKLGKHFVANCRLGALTERQQQKVNALATMKIVAICELQHCTLTLVPFKAANQEVRMVAFIIADD